MNTQPTLGHRVKGLEWDGVIAVTPFCSYTVGDYGDDAEDWRFYRSEYPYGDRSDDGYPTEAEAKAAAQADYERRILSALSVSPRQEGEPVGYLFRLRYGPDRWSQQLMYSEVLPNEGDYKELQPLYAAPSNQQPVAFQDRVAEAHHALFHDDPTDLAERRDRFYEEATETVQALGMTADEAHQLVDYTFSRPSGDVRKEIGAAALTLASLCVVGGWDMQACADADLAALTTPEKIAKVRAKRATRHGRGPLPGFDAALEVKQGKE